MYTKAFNTSEKLILRLSKLFEIISFTSFDTSTSEGRSNERYRRIILAALASILARCIGIIATLISVPLTIRYLGTERYGLWLTMSSLISILSFTDLGMGNGLLNAISEANGKDDKNLASKYVSSAFFMLLGISVILCAAFLLIYDLISWSIFFNVKSPLAISESGPATIVFVVCFLINLPLSVVQRIQTGYQEGFFNSLWLAIGNILAIVSLLGAIYFETGLPWLVLALAGAPLVSTFVNGIVLFGWKYPWLRPRLDNISLQISQKLFRVGFLFLILQIASAVAYQSDNIVLARILGASVVPQYAVPVKLFALIPMLLGFVVAPLWPAYGEAIARKDVTWARKTLFRSIRISLLISVPATLALLIFGVQIIHLWVGNEITPSYLLLLGLGAWTLLSSIGGTWAMFLNGASVIRFQVICALLMCTTNIVLSIFLTRIIGISGVVFGSLISQILFVSLPSMIYIPKYLSKLDQSARKI